MFGRACIRSLKSRQDEQFTHLNEGVVDTLALLGVVARSLIGAIVL